MRACQGLRVGLLWLALLGGPAFTTAHAEPVVTGLSCETLLRSGPEATRIDIVFCGDGYQKSQRKELKSDVEALLTELWAISPYKELKSEFNVHLVYLDAPPGPRIDGKRSGDFLLGSHKRAGEASDLVHLRYPQRVSAVVANAPACDVSIVVTRMEGRSHSGQPMVISRGYRLVLAHEMGHFLGQLGDEYTSSQLTSDRERHPFPKSGDLPHANLTLAGYIDPSTPDTIRKTSKWKHFLDLPDGDLVSAYQGGYYRVMDVWRPTNACIMGMSKYSLFCPVCHEQLYRSVLEKNGKTFEHDRYHREFPLKLWRSRRL